ncbi:hypothetical protein NQT65_09160 [Pseudoalteromonas agarivorans]|uniref:hypothetical protein n=1 Tax=Pseudoalteromonas agarivorans TaxID=176102 RepID=UPI002117B1BC|nr:hypothetical protein [Pseudoalteromonas agarivorans]MCQ8820372.1 hypothetical protein [Pseudoalteromonas agarivorans]
MAKPVTLAHFLFCPNEPATAAHPSLHLMRTLAIHCKAHYPHAPGQFISRHLYLQLCWQTIYAYCYWHTSKQNAHNPTQLQLKINGAYSRGFNLSGAPILSKAEQNTALIEFISCVGKWINTDYALGEKEQGRLLIVTLNSAFERAHSLHLASADHTTHCHQQLHNLISNHFNLHTPFKLTPKRLTCCRYFLAGYNKCQTCPKKDIKTNEHTS